jgi:hypothetical protein
MFANPVWSVLLLVSTAALYWLVIRPRLKVKFTDVYAHIGSFWKRWLARIVAFRSYVATVVAALLIGLPDLVVAISPVDFSGIIGEEWAKKVAAGLAIYLAVNRAFSTKPGEDK